jgi:hypothetical protein
MKKFTVYPSVRLQAHKLLINSNKLKHVFYNTGKTFIINSEDLDTCYTILENKFIKLKVIN